MQALLKGNFVTMSYIILPKAVQQQPVRCNSSMPTCQGQVWAPEHYYCKNSTLYFAGVRPVGEWDWG